MKQKHNQSKGLSDTFSSVNKYERDSFLSSLMEEKSVSSRLLEWGAILALENKEWGKAESLFSSLLERRRKTSDWLGLAKALFEQSRFDEAEECYLEAIDQITEPGSLLFILYKSLAEVYLLKRDFLMAEEYYNKAGTLDPHCKDIVFRRAMMYLKEKNYGTAEKFFQTFVESHEHHAKSWLGLAITRKALGDQELALACLNRCLDFDPENQMAVKLKEKWQPPLAVCLSDPLSFSA